MNLIAIVIVLGALGIPFCFVLNITSLFGLLQMDNWNVLRLIPQRLYAGMDLFVLLAIPLFILAGEIMNRAKITDSLVQIANALVGHLRGGLAHASILSCMFFAGITGSAVSETAAIGAIMIPAMEKEGYGKAFACAIIAAASVIGPIIPPSITFIFYSAVVANYPSASVSVAGMFAGGLVPGLVVGFSLMTIAYIISVKRNYPKREHWGGWKNLWVASRRAFLPLIIPVIILGGILAGFFTPTEAAAVAAGVGLIIGFFVFRTLKISDLVPIFAKSGVTSATILFIISAGNLMGYFLQLGRAPEQAADFFLQISNNFYVLSFLVFLLLYFAGMFMETGVIMIILAPILAPFMVSQGMDPLHFGMMMTINLIIGMITPPFGLILFATCGLTGVKFDVLVKEILPFLLVETAVIILVTFVPAVTMTVPRLLGYAR